MTESQKKAADEANSWRLHVYWIGEGDLTWMSETLARLGPRTKKAKLTPCRMRIQGAAVVSRWICTGAGPSSISRPRTRTAFSASPIG